MGINLIKDATFLTELDNENIKTYYVQILVLDKDELPIRAIEGRVSAGSITIDGSSSIRRAGNLTFLAEETENDLTDIDNLLSMNKKIKILVGIENNVDTEHDSIIWFNQGIFIITQPSISHSTTGVIISIQFKDKMCLLNGECGGNLPTSVTFDSYDQIIGLQSGLTTYPSNPNNYTVYQIDNEYYMWTTERGWYASSLDVVGETISISQCIYDIIQTLVCNYGGEDIGKIVINDIDRELKNSVRYTGSDTLYYNTATSMYTLDEEVAASNPGTWISYNYNDDCGYIYTDFIYPGGSSGLVSSIGDNVCTVLDKIKSALGNYEYFYDVDGNFIFQEIKNYLNTQYECNTIGADRIECNYTWQEENGEVPDARLTQLQKSQILDGTADIPTILTGMGKKNVIYSFTKEDSDGVTVLYKYYYNSETLGWEPYTGSNCLLTSDNYYIDFNNTGKSIYTFQEGSTLISAYSNSPNYLNIKNDFHIWGKNEDASVIHYHIAIKEKPAEPFETWKVVAEKEDGEYTGRIHLASVNEVGYDYTPTDWRAELYMIGLQKKSLQQRPDIYEQELLDLFDNIYNMREKCFKTDIVTTPNELIYWFDYINPSELYDISVDAIGTKIYSYQQDKIKRLYNTDIPNVILIDENAEAISQASLIRKCEKIGQPFARVSDKIYNNISLGTVGYSAQEVARDLLYQYTNYTSAISLTSIPIYYLDVNNRITVYDRAAGIYGDYVIKSISMPLDAKSTMSISASKALDRI